MKYLVYIISFIIGVSAISGCSTTSEQQTVQVQQQKQYTPLDTLETNYFKETEKNPLTTQGLNYTIEKGHFLIGNETQTEVEIEYPQIDSISMLPEDTEQNIVIEQMHSDFEKTALFRKGALAYFMEQAYDTTTGEQKFPEVIFANTDYRVQTANDKIVSVFFEESVSPIGGSFNYSAAGVTISLEENRVLQLSEMITDFDMLFTLLQTDQFTPIPYWQDNPKPFSQVLTETTNMKEEWIEILKNNNKRTFFVEAENGAEILWETREFEWYLWDNKLVLIYLGDKYYQQYFIELEKIKDIIDTDFYEKYILQTPQEGE